MRRVRRTAGSLSADGGPLTCRLRLRRTLDLLRPDCVELASDPGTQRLLGIDPRCGGSGDRLKALAEAPGHPDAFHYSVVSADGLDVTVPEHALSDDVRGLFERTIQG